MLRSMYSSVSGLKAQQTKMDVIGNNIANVSTVGFKAGDAYFKELIPQDTGSVSEGSPFNREVGLGVEIAAIDTKFTQGSLQTTGNNLDFAIEGGGMFVTVPASVYQGGNPTAIDFTNQDQIADVTYTRDGIFRWDTEGYLRTAEGNYVLSKDGEPVTYEATLGNPNGAVTVESVLAVANFFNPAGLDKLGGNNYAQSDKSGAPVFGGAGDETVEPVTGAIFKNGVIRSGCVEMSNVDLATEFTNMIVVSRAYQANSRTITTSDEMLQELINLKR